MLNKILSTPIDDLVRIVKKTGRCKLSYLNKELNISSSVLDKWLVILEEYNILEVNYSGLDGEVHYIEKLEEQKEEENNFINVNALKIDFTKKSKLKSISEEKTKSLWKMFINQYETEIRNNFLKISEKKGHEKSKTEKAWKKYREELYNF